MRPMLWGLAGQADVSDALAQHRWRRRRRRVTLYEQQQQQKKGQKSHRFSRTLVLLSRSLSLSALSFSLSLSSLGADVKGRRQREWGVGDGRTCTIDVLSAGSVRPSVCLALLPMLCFLCLAGTAHLRPSARQISSGISFLACFLSFFSYFFFAFLGGADDREDDTSSLFAQHGPTWEQQEASRGDRWESGKKPYRERSCRCRTVAADGWMKLATRGMETCGPLSVAGERES